MEYLRWLSVAVFVLFSMSAVVHADDTQNGGVEPNCDGFVDELLADITKVTRSGSGQDACLLLRGAGVFRGTQYQHSYVEMAGALASQSAVPEHSLPELTLAFPELAGQVSEPATGFASEVTRQRYVLRSLAARAASRGQWDECQALYAMSTAGDMHEERFSFEYVLSLFDLVHDCKVQPPEFAIGYHLSHANRSTQWKQFLANSSGYAEVFARAGWAAGWAARGDLERGRAALKRAMAVLGDQPPVTRLFFFEIDASIKAITVLTIAELTSEDRESPFLDECLAEARTYCDDRNCPMHASARERLALLYHKKGDKARAAELWKEVGDSWVRCPFATEEREFRMAKHMVLLGRPRAALERIEKARTSTGQGTHPMALEVLLHVASDGAPRDMSWSETEAVIEPRNDSELIWAKLGWLEGSLRRDARGDASQ